MLDYFGIIEIVSVENELLSTEENSDAQPAFVEMKDTDVRVVHYPDCQQLIVMLPQQGTEYGILKLWDRNHKTVIEDGPVSNRLNGNIQMLWDTLYLAPGLYLAEIEWQHRHQHCITFIKHKEVKKPAAAAYDLPKPKQTQTTVANITKPTKTVVANVIKPAKRLEYEGTLRGGSVVYFDGDISIKFDHEMGGGNCLVYVFIPSKKYWEAQTKTPLTQRESILQYVAETIQKEQASGCRFEITETQISFYQH